MAKESFFSSSIGRKIAVSLTGIFLITFLIVHVGLNATILLNDGGKTFNAGAHFMAYNWLIRVMEVGLFAGFLIHIVLTLVLYFQNRSKRPVAYAKVDAKENSRWYSRSMALLGSLLLIFLVIHINQFWSDKLIHVYINGEQEIDAYTMVIDALKSPVNLVIYIGAFIALSYHLLHGFPSAFQTLGLNHKKYKTGRFADTLCA
jgi:succinate dehydrogenase / fumarate reductase cytochrome b subunit